MAAIFHHPLANYLGFHREKVHSQKSVEDTSIIGKIGGKKWNISVALNVIPIIGNILAGIYHIYKALTADEGRDNILLARGIAECTVIGGVLLAIGDAVVTVGRICTNPPTAESL
jgi:hypothetical protein